MKRYSLEEAAKMILGACALLAALYVLYWLVYGFGTLAPGDFPWEDVFPKPLAELIYWFAGRFEATRDILYGVM